MSISWHLVGLPERAILALPPDAADLAEAHAAIELWEFYSGKRLDPDQRLAVEIMMAVDRDGLWAAKTTGRAKPRQNGKGDELEVVELWGLVQRAEAILHTVHDAVLLATQAQQRMLGVLEGHADLRRLIARKWMGTGQQMVEMRNGGVIWYRTRTNGGGRGVDKVDRVVIDEAQHATEEHLAAIAPTQLAVDNPQLNATGSAGIAGKSRWWWRMRRRALGSSPGRFGYLEHTAERVALDDAGVVTQEPVDVEDRELWLAANPAIAVGRGGGMAFLEEQLKLLGPMLFLREHGGVWDRDDTTTSVTVWPPGKWEAVCASDVAQPVAGLVFGVHVNADRSRAAIAVSGGGGSCGLVDDRPGTGWAIDELARIALAARARVALVGRSASGSLAADLERAGLDVQVVSQVDAATACGWLYDAVDQGRLLVKRHAVLDAAAQHAAKRLVGKDGAFVWDSATGDVHALWALTVAAWAAQTSDRVVDMAGQVF